MVKPEWGTKRSCPKCSTRFYDLTKEDPVTCISCGYAWLPEPVLKSKQPLPFESAAPEKVAKQDDDLAADELVIDEDEEPSADEEVDLATGDEDLGVSKGDEDDEV
ncbi:MAG TPA: TIGR02300 family protein [Sphingomicrobium sp.]|nr:TIGR02300 family protein [Sphingomicrobium sp.]